MPTATFYNLNKEKKNKVIEAGLKEFTDHSFYNASVSNIIVDANISRGSFYQYFENLDDFYYFLIDRFIESFEDMKKIGALEDWEGDLRSYIEEYGKEFITYLMYSNQTDFMRRVYHDMNRQVEHRHLKRFRDELKDNIQDIDFYNSYNENKDENQKRMQEFVNLVSQLLSSSIIYGFEENLRIQEMIEVFKNKIAWLFKGIENETQIH